MRFLVGTAIAFSVAAPGLAEEGRMPGYRVESARQQRAPIPDNGGRNGTFSVRRKRRIEPGDEANTPVRPRHPDPRRQPELDGRGLVRAHRPGMRDRRNSHALDVTG